jgi:hypothetical protein
VDKYGIERIPAVAVIGKDEFKVRFYGTLTGYVFDSLIETIKMVSVEKIALSEATKTFLDSIDAKIGMKIIISDTCPYCPQAVELAVRLAFYSKRITVDILAIGDYPWLAVKYGVTDLPRTVINEKGYIDGTLPEKDFVGKLKALVR